jgi:hypothetical protein
MIMSWPELNDESLEVARAVNNIFNEVAHGLKTRDLLVTRYGVSKDDVSETFERWRVLKGLPLMPPDHPLARKRT